MNVGFTVKARSGKWWLVGQMWPIDKFCLGLFSTVYFSVGWLPTLKNGDISYCLKVFLASLLKKKSEATAVLGLPSQMAAPARADEPVPSEAHTCAQCAGGLSSPSSSRHLRCPLGLQVRDPRVGVQGP